MADRILSLVESFAQQRSSLMKRTSAQVEQLWRNVDPYDGMKVDEFSQNAAMLSTASQQQIAYLTTAHQMAVLSELGISFDFIPVIPDDVRLFSDDGYDHANPVLTRTSSGISRRLPTAEVFNRPARKYRYLKSIGKSDDEALDVSINRVKINIETNLLLAERESELETMKSLKKKSKKVLGYRRIIHPERSKGGSCGLCVAAADRIYSTSDMKPLHDNCECTVLPITKSEDPGMQMNKRDLGRLYDEAGGTARAQLSKLRFQVEDHGELGPVLVAPTGFTIPHFSSVKPDLSLAA